MADRVKLDEARIHQQKLAEAYENYSSQLDQWERFEDDYAKVHERLRTLPDKTSHDIMVPLGKVAFMPGKLIHTNELLVLLGENLFAERSAKQAVQLVERRMQYVAEKKAEVQHQLDDLQTRAQYSGQLAGEYGMDEEGNPIVEIVEREDGAGGDNTGKAKVNQTVPGQSRTQNRPVRDSQPSNVLSGRRIAHAPAHTQAAQTSSAAQRQSGTVGTAGTAKGEKTQAQPQQPRPEDMWAALERLELAEREGWELSDDEEEEEEEPTHPDDVVEIVETEGDQSTGKAKGKGKPRVSFAETEFHEERSGHGPPPRTSASAPAPFPGGFGVMERDFVSSPGAGQLPADDDIGHEAAASQLQQQPQRISKFKAARMAKQ